MRGAYLMMRAGRIDGNSGRRDEEKQITEDVGGNFDLC